MQVSARFVNKYHYSVKQWHTLLPIYSDVQNWKSELTLNNTKYLKTDTKEKLRIEQSQILVMLTCSIDVQLLKMKFPKYVSLRNLCRAWLSIRKFNLVDKGTIAVFGDWDKQIRSIFYFWSCMHRIYGLQKWFRVTKFSRNKFF